MKTMATFVLCRNCELWQKRGPSKSQLIFQWRRKSFFLWTFEQLFWHQMIFSQGCKLNWILNNFWQIDSAQSWCWLLMPKSAEAAEINWGWDSNDCVAASPRLWKNFNQQMFPWENILCNAKQVNTQYKTYWKVLSSSKCPLLLFAMPGRIVNKQNSHIIWLWRRHVLYIHYVLVLEASNDHNHWITLVLDIPKDLPLETVHQQKLTGAG